MFLIYSLCIILVICIAFLYIFNIKPNRTVKKIVSQFQAHGYKVLVEPLNFTKQNIFPRFLKNLEKYGDTHYHLSHDYQGYDVIVHNSMHYVFLYIANINLIKDCYNQIQKLEKINAVRQTFARLYGGGLLMSEGKQWKQKRRLYSEIFNYKLLEEIQPHIQEITKKTMESWNIENDVDMLLQFRKLLFNCFVVSYFGCDFDGFSYKNQTFGQSICHVWNELFQQSFDWRSIVFGPQILDKGWNKRDREIKEHLDAIKSQTKQFVLKRFQQISKKQVGSENNILSKLVFNQYFTNISEQEKDKKIEDIVGDVLMFFFAGTDTTSSTLAATLHILYKHPEITKRLIQQLKENGGVCNMSNMKNFKYMDAVLNESLRMYGPVNQIGKRKTNDNTVIGGIHLPKDILLSIETVTIHHSQTYYQNPFDFKPQRWLDPKNNQVPFSFVSFSGGTRNCIGQHLARIQYKTILSLFLKKFTFETHQPFVMEYSIIYAPKNNLFRLKKK